MLLAKLWYNNDNNNNNDKQTVTNKKKYMRYTLIKKKKKTLNSTECETEGANAMMKHIESLIGSPEHKVSQIPINQASFSYFLFP